MKHSKLLFGFITILGVIFLILCLVGSYLYVRDSVSVLASFGTQLGFWFVLSGTGLVTVGILGLDWKNVKKYRKRFVALYVVLIPLTTFVIVWFASLNIMLGAPISIQRSEITQVIVIDTNPLILSVDVKAITSKDGQIECAFIINDDNGTLVTHMDHPDEGPLAVLPSGSEISLTLNFDTTLTSGNYIVLLSSWNDHVGHGRYTFTIS